MFWPFILPFKITCVVLGVLVLLITGWAPKLKWKRWWAFGISAMLALLAFVPSCSGVWYVLDQFRFGYFEYATFDDINDFRAERYMPPAATDIWIYKHEHANGSCARYVISEADFHAYLDGLWDKYGDYSAVRRGEISGEGRPASPDDMASICACVGCQPLAAAVKYRSPTEPDGGGATYYFDSEAGVALQDTGYW